MHNRHFIRSLVLDPQSDRLGINGGAFAKGNTEVIVRKPPYEEFGIKTSIDLNATFQFLGTRDLLVRSGTSLYKQSLTFTGAEHRSNTLAGHTEAIVDMQVAEAEGETWILSFAGGVAHLHRDHGLAKTFQSPDDPLQQVALSPDGQLVAGGLFNGGVRLWFTKTFAEKRLLASGVYAKAVDTQDPQSLVVAGGKNIGDGDTGGPFEAVYAWKQFGKERLWPKGLNNLNQCEQILVCLADRDLIAAAGPCEGVRFWRISTGTIEHEFHDTGTVDKLVCLPKQGAVTAGAQGIYYWPLQGPSGRALLPNSSVPVATLALSPKKDAVLAAWPDGKMQSFDTRDFKPSATSFRTALSGATLADNRTALVADSQGDVWEVPLRGGEPLRRQGLTATKLLKVSPDGRLLASVHRGVIRIGWRNGPTMYSLGRSSDVEDLVFSEDGRHLLIATYSGVHIYPLPPSDLSKLSRWLAPRTPFESVNGTLRAKPFPGLQTLSNMPW